MIRKVALVGCPQSPWVRTYGMRNLRLNTRARQDTMLKVLQRDSQGSVSQKVFVGPGFHNLDDSEWTQVFVADGSHIDALCTLEGT